MTAPNLQQRILEVFRKFGEPCTRAEARAMLEEPDVTGAEFGSRVSNLVRYGHVDAITGKDGIVRYVFAGMASRKGRKVKRADAEEPASKPAKAARAEPAAAEKPAKRKYTRKPREIGTVVAVGADSIQVESDHAHGELQIAATIKLAADTARELAVIALTHPRPLSDRVRKAVIDLVRIAA